MSMAKHKKPKRKASKHANKKAKKRKTAPARKQEYRGAITAIDSVGGAVILTIDGKYSLPIDNAMFRAIVAGECKKESSELLNRKITWDADKISFVDATPK